MQNVVCIENFGGALFGLCPPHLSCSTATFAVLRLLTQSSKQQRAGVRRASPPVGLEPTTFELEVQHASPLRHGGDVDVYLLWSLTWGSAGMHCAL